jgi:high affinity Mn2+ porin
MNVNTQTTYGGIKYGMGLNAEQALSENTSAFMRLGWNDGHSATWAFTEIDNTITGGINIKGKRWKRPDDMLGIAYVLNGISKDHWDFLNYGGYGFLIGDGQLPHYGSEQIFETYYSVQITKTLWFSGDYQYIQNPAYNRERGPLNVWALRAHVQF